MKAGTQEHAAAKQRRNFHSESRRATDIGAAFVAQQEELDLELLEENNTSFRGSYDDEVTKTGIIHTSSRTSAAADANAVDTDASTAAASFLTSSSHLVGDTTSSLNAYSLQQPLGGINNRL